MKTIEDVYDLPMPDCGIIHLKAKQPLYDWANNLVDDGMGPGGDDDGIALVVNDELALDQVDRYIRKNYLALFEHFLFGMWTNEKDWPPKLTYRLFAEWIEWQYCSMVFDVR